MKNLITFIKQHAIEVVSHTDDTITVLGVYTKGGAVYSHQEILNANWNSVRNWLGY